MNIFTPNKTYSKRSFLNTFFKTALAAVFVFITVDASAQTVKALSNGKIYTFNAATPSTFIGLEVTITGVSAGQAVVGMDYRPATGELYLLGYNATSNAARLYTVDATTGIATAVGSKDTTLALGTGPIGMDFNPTVDRIRVVSANNKNYRLHPVTGVIVATDGDLQYKTAAPADPNAGQNPFIGSCAYTNSYIGATSTTLYDYDDSLNVFSTQNPPNAGTLNTIVGNTGLTLNTVDRSSDLDIFYDRVNNVNTAYLAFNSGTATNDNFYTVNLTTGATTLVGAIGPANGGIPVQDIAVLIDRTVPTLSGRLVHALSTTNNLISFTAENPSIIRTLNTITGLKAGQTVVGMDFRPSNGLLYALGLKTGTDTVSLYTLNTTTGAATLVKDTLLKLAGIAGNIGFDFNPTVDRIRVIASNGKNFRLNPVTVAVAAMDTNLSYKAGDVNASKTPFVGSGAYTNSFMGATSTQLFNIDDSLSILTLQNTPNGGFQNTVGPLGITLSRTDATSDIDIAYTTTTATNTAYLAANAGTNATDNFYTVNVATGAVSLVGRIGFGISIRDIAAENALITAGINNQVEKSFGLSVYPNPSTGASTINFTLDAPARTKVIVYDYSGKLISVLADQKLAAGNQSVELNTTGLAKGVYFVTLTVNNESQNVTKVVVQ